MSRWIGPGLVATAVAAWMLPAQTAATLPEPCAPGRAPAVAVAAAMDGGTLALADGRIVALAGIDPVFSPLSSDEPSVLSEAARAALAGAVGAAPAKVAIVGSRPDRYGRLRANVFSGTTGRSVAEALVAQGLARVHRLTGDPACVLALLGVERRARIDGRGMWSDPMYKIRSAADPALAAETGLYALVAGRVLSVGHGQVMNFINFGRDYDADFTVMVTAAVAKNLASAGIDLNALAGRRVLVRGMVEASGGPAIRLSDAADIEVLDDDDD